MLYKLNSLHLNPIRSKIDGHLFPVHNYYFAMQLCFIKAVFPIANADCRVRNRRYVDKMQTEPMLCEYIDIKTAASLQMSHNRTQASIYLIKLFITCVINPFTPKISLSTSPYCLSALQCLIRLMTI